MKQPWSTAKVIGRGLWDMEMYFGPMEVKNLNL